MFWYSVDFWIGKKKEFKSLLFKITFYAMEHAWQSLNIEWENYLSQQAWQNLENLLSVIILPIFSITDHSTFLKTPYFSPYLEACPHVREELRTFQRPYFVHLVAQSWLGSLGRAKPVFWERIRPSDYTQSKQAAPPKPRVSMRSQVYLGAAMWEGSLVFPESAGPVSPSHCSEHHSPWLQFHMGERFFGKKTTIQTKKRCLGHSH